MQQSCNNWKTITKPPTQPWKKSHMPCAQDTFNLKSMSVFVKIIIINLFNGACLNKEDEDIWKEFYWPYISSMMTIV